MTKLFCEQYFDFLFQINLVLDRFNNFDKNLKFTVDTLDEGLVHFLDITIRSDGETDVTLFEILEAVDHAVDSVVDVIIPIPKETNEDRVALPDNTKERKEGRVY